MLNIRLGSLAALSVWLLVFPAPQVLVGENRGDTVFPNGAPSDEDLQRQEELVAKLRDSEGATNPTTLVALARLIRLRTARGDLAGGTPLFDELLDLDLRTSPILAYGEPPIEVARTLGGLGELAAACALLEAGLARSQRVESSVFALEVGRALARLKVALEDSEGISHMREIEAKWVNLLATDSLAAQAIGGNRIRFSEREKTAPGVRPEMSFWLYPPGSSWSEGPGSHEHFDLMLEIAPKAAFETAERLRAATRMDLSLLTRIRRQGASQDEPASERRDHRLEVGQHPLRGGPTPADAELTKIATALKAVTRALDRISSTDPRFESLRTERARLQRLRTQHLNKAWSSVEEVDIPITPSDFQQSLGPGTVLLYYMVTTDHTDLLVLASEGGVSHHRVAMGSQDLASDLARLLAEWNREPTRGATLLGNPSAQEEAARVARRLFQALVAPAKREIEAAGRLLIVPDGPLHQLPFAALQRQDDRGRDQYVAEWKPIHLAPSAATYAALVARRQDSGKRRGGLVAFGNPAYDRSVAVGQERALPYVVRSAVSRGFSGALDPLPGSQREVEQIGQLFGNHGRDARVLLGPRAREGSVKEVRQSAFLHLAVHGFVDSEQPEHSFLALSLPEALVEGEENGILEGWEIVDEMRLDAELVTLSACETALGPERNGEGLTNLSRAFLAAGARSVLAALWKVDDATTADLMTSFYRHLMAGSTKTEALRSAQLELLQGAKHRAPYFWAGFQLTGDWQ